VAKRETFVIDVPHKDVYAADDLFKLHEQFSAAAAYLELCKAPLRLRSVMGIETVTVAIVDPRGLYGLERTYSFNSEYCRRRILASRDVESMGWTAAIPEIVSLLRDALASESRRVRQRADSLHSAAQRLQVRAASAPAKVR
jgi:hypothetical protein